MTNNRSVKDGKKTCTLCKEIKLVEQFGRRGGKTKQSHHVKSRCKECENTQQKLYSARKRQEDPSAQRKYWLSYKYGITLEEYDQLLSAQNGVCAICHLPESKIDPRTGQIKTLSVDHCHTSELVRALLCDDCNIALGKLKDSPMRLLIAAEYVRSNCARREEYCLHSPKCSTYKVNLDI